ncbi:uncharacterized protein [Diadema antillarum]|uniref:uncharacterized protein n=1 Tax=Diadema antillarum TaxID=105358 RepID=UPI003A86B7D2
MATEVIVISSEEEEGASGVTVHEENPDDVFIAAGSTALFERSNTFKRPKLEEVAISSDSADEEDHQTPLQPRTVNSNVGPLLYKQKWHAFKEKSTFFKDSERIAKALLFPSVQVNNSVPVGCDQELCFLIDTSQLRFAEDITCDETGKYQKPSRAKCRITVNNDGNVGPSEDIGSCRTYTFVRKYYKHRDTPNFQRMLYELHDAEEGTMHPICMVRYEWKGEKTELIISPHGNEKHSERPYIRSKKELLQNLKSSHCSSAQKVVDDYYEKEGGSDLHSFASVPRDRKQVYRHGSVKAKSSDFSELLKMNLKGDFVKSVEFCHEKGSGSMPRCVLYTDKQAEDMRRNVCEKGKVLVFDSTFDCGPMYLTIASYRHDNFVNRSNDRSVLMPGAILIHGRRDFETYRYFGNELSKGLQHTSVQFYGTDGEIALQKGIAATSSFKDSSHLHCMLHHKRNCEAKLAKLGVRRNARRIVRSIYGEQVDGTRYEGLADCSTEEEYELQLAAWAPQWDALETEESGREAEFSTWFRRFKSADVKTSMLKPLRNQAGLGDPPRQFTTNDAESINAMVSKWISGKKGWDELAKCLQDFVVSKYRELEMAVLGIGERKLDHQHKHLQKTTVQWRNMSKEEHKEVLQQAHLIPEVHAELSIGPDESSVCGFTSEQLQDVWHKAGLILQSPGNIVHAPNNPQITVCFSEISNFTVTQKGEMAKFVCEEKCKSFSFHERLFCEHCLAVAEHRGVLADFLVTINAKKRASTVSLVNKALQQQCRGSGKKQATKRRGANNTTACEVKNVVRMPQTHQPFTVARKVGLISRCYGCMQKFSEQMNLPPRDLILRKLDFREWVDKNTGEMKRSQSLVPTYYHMKMDCVRRRYPITEIKDILLYDEVKEQLCEEHLTKLRNFGLSFH